MFLYGDVHGDWDWFIRVQGKYVKDPYAILLGDVGVGFPADCRQDFAYLNEDQRTFPPDFGETVAFIRGNHDDPALCRTHPCYLGDYGYNESADLFYISGADSIDKGHRTIGIDWWDDEELPWEELEKMVELFVETKPKYVISHTCPARLFETPLIRSRLLSSSAKKVQHRTEMALQAAWERHQPFKWYFGHFHRSGNNQLGRTRFYCIGIRQRVEIPGVVLEYR